MKFAYSILLLVFSVIILCEVTGVYFLYEFKKSLQDRIVEDSEKVDAMMVHRIDSYAIERLVDLTNLAKSSTFESAIEDSNAKFYAMADPDKYLDEQNAAWVSAPKDKTTAFMENLIGSGPSDQLRQIQQFEGVLFGGRMYDDILMTNAYGANVIEMAKTAKYKHSNEAWWNEAKNNGMYIGGMEFGDGKAPSYVTAVQLVDQYGNVIGVAKATVSTQQMIKIIKSQMNSTDPSPVEYELISNGTVIYSTDPAEKPGLPNRELEYSGNLKGTTGHFTQTIGDEDYLVTYSHSANTGSSPVFNWIFVTKFKSSEIMKPVAELSNLIVTTILALLVTVSTTIFVMSRKLARPIEQVRQGLVLLNRGEAVKIKPHGEEEVRDLIEQFNHAVDAHSSAGEASKPA